MGRLVPDEGLRSARIVLVGEAPGQEEERKGRPFVGPSGLRLQDWWSKVGLHRSAFYITNVWPERPYNNRIETVNREALGHAVVQLHERLAALDDPWLIVPTGNIALRALMGRPLWGKDSAKITDWRGSILEYRDNRKRSIKVIPTLHPAFTFREPGAERACLHDWKRIARDATFRELRLPEREHQIEPTVHDLMQLQDLLIHNPEMPLAFDIETTQRGGNQILCIGFSTMPEWSITVPTTPAYWAGKTDLDWVWAWVRSVLELPNPKITQNGHYDYYWLGLLHNIKPVRWLWDTLGMHHALDATDSHSLDYMASTLTRQPYWKRECKDPEAIAKYINDEHALWTYNGIDCCVTLELQQKLLKRLERRGLLDFYIRHYRHLMRPALALMRHGIRTDDTARRWWHFNIQAERIELQDRLAETAGKPLHAAKALAAPRITKFLYDKQEAGGLGLPPQRSRTSKTGGPTSNEAALRKLVLWALSRGSKWQPAVDAIGLVLQERRIGKLLDFLSPRLIDADEKLRATFKLTTVTGRFASAKNPMRGGTNLQNQDREVRQTFVPDRPDQIFLEVDMSQIESRIVYVLSGRPELIGLAQKHPADYDQHTENAKLIFGADFCPKSRDKERFNLQRYVGKKTSHGAQRGLGPEKLAATILNDTEGKVIRSQAQCAGYLQRYMERTKIDTTYFPKVRKAILRDRKLVNTFGREWLVTHERMCDDLYRKGYSWQPQSDAGDLMNQHGVKPAMKLLATSSLDAAINAQVHDSLLLSTTPTDAYDLAAFLQTTLETPLDYGYCKLSVPVEFKLGRSWAGDLEFKKLPDRATFTAAARAVLKGDSKGLDEFR